MKMENNLRATTEEKGLALLAGTGVLLSLPRAAGAFLVLWGAFWTAAMQWGSVFPQHPLLLLAGLGAFLGGALLLLRLRQVFFDPAARVIETRSGFPWSLRRTRMPIAAFDRIRIQDTRAWTRSGPGLLLRAVTLAGPKGSAGPTVSLGNDYSERQDALAAAVRVAQAVDLPVIEESGSHGWRMLTRAALAASGSAAPPPRWRQPSAIALVLANLVPLAGVLLDAWDISRLLLLYWLENLAIGLFTVARMLLAREGPSSSRMGHIAGTLLLSVFFAAHFGAFTAGHGYFLVKVIGNTHFLASGPLDPFNPLSLLGFVAGVVQHYGLHVAALALLVSHGVSFFLHYVRPRAYLDADPRRLMLAPYGRVVVMHVAVLGAGFAAASIGAPLAALLAVTALKIAIDLALHLASHPRHLLLGLQWSAVPPAFGGTAQKK